MAKSQHPQSYGAFLYPGFGLLDVAGPLEVLNSLSRLDGQEGITLSILAKTMNPVTPAAPDGKRVGITSKQQ